jgi:hypothetical protein
VLKNGHVIAARRAEIGTRHLNRGATTELISDIVARHIDDLRASPAASGLPSAPKRGLLLVGDGAVYPDLFAVLSSTLRLHVYRAATPARRRSTAPAWPPCHCYATPRGADDCAPNPQEGTDDHHTAQGQSRGRRTPGTAPQHDRGTPATHTNRPTEPTMYQRLPSHGGYDPHALDILVPPRASGRRVSDSRH